MSEAYFTCPLCDRPNPEHEHWCAYAELARVITERDEATATLAEALTSAAAWEAVARAYTDDTTRKFEQARAAMSHPTQDGPA